MRGVWRGLVRGKPFGFIGTNDGRRVFCHERQLRDLDIQEGDTVSFQLEMRNGKEEASMVQAFSQAGNDRHGQRPALVATRGADHGPDHDSRPCGPIPPKLLMMTYDEANTMQNMGCTTQQHVHGPCLDKIYQVEPCDLGLAPIDAIFSSRGFEIAQAQQFSRELNAIKSELDEKDIKVCVFVKTLPANAFDVTTC